MVKFGFYVELKAKPGKEADVESFLKQGAVMAKAEAGIVSWYAAKEEEPGVYGIIDTFKDEVGRDAHLNGELAKALFGRAEELFAVAPKVHRLHVIAEK
ncbi:antibiotic biosynthesis monooxygenase [Bradyrhizobium sp. CB2312]|uniref:putative quinol monooxygenase n=1 Tax=Bradyrhizobium sp. CB2312 TaxID=3039155 RepID=UPI0024B2550D|nr:antibiotic biosynthesis monooxygenase [Bradyrhizobium sp. CB2312]WFU74867.1 antibiotic biosynthesis monooxygenase [Bradyrhizobium sp. CB2312]